MGEYEPDDSRTVTQKPGHGPGEPPRTGPREDQTRKPDEAGKADGKEGTTVRQHNNAQEATHGPLPDPHRAAAGFDQDEG